MCMIITSGYLHHRYKKIYERLNAIVSVNSTRLLCKSLFYLATLKVEFNFSLQLHENFFKTILTSKVNVFIMY